MNQKVSRALLQVLMWSAIVGSFFLLSEPALAAEDMLDAMYSDYQAKVMKLIKYLFRTWWILYRLGLSAYNSRVLLCYVLNSPLLYRELSGNDA